VCVRAKFSIGETSPKTTSYSSSKKERERKQRRKVNNGNGQRMHTSIFISKHNQKQKKINDTYY